MERVRIRNGDYRGRGRLVLERVAMRRFRRLYYDIFSRFYDRFVALHSHDRLDSARGFLTAIVPAEEGGVVLDLCTGTGTLLPYLQAKVGEQGRVVGVDFSVGMLRKAREKTSRLRNVLLVEAEAERLPFEDESFDAVTCSHAFYELKGLARERALGEIVRVLKPNGAFLMMEHEIPLSPVTKALFYLRLLLAGSGHAFAFLKQELSLLGGYFASVEKVAAPGGRSKVVICRKRCA
ncbi:MAG: methyltransferase domain-containing protein [Acidobacteriaceae bacterium]